MDHLVRRINLLKARLTGQGLETISKLPQPAYLAFLSSGGQDVGPDVRKKFGSLYFYYLAWRTDTLRHQPGGRDPSRVAPARPGVPRDELPVARRLGREAERFPAGVAEGVLGRFQVISGERPISPAFTKKGRSRSIRSSGRSSRRWRIPSPWPGRRRKLGRYPQACLLAWGQFAAGFQRGVDTLKGQKEWQGVAARAATDQGPHMAFVARLASELEFLGEEENLPAWFQQAYQFQSIRSQAQAAGGGREGDRERQETAGEDRADVRQGRRELTALAAQKTYQEYLASLTAVVQASASRAQAFQLAAQTYGEDPSAGNPLLRWPGGGGASQSRHGRNHPRTTSCG